MDDDDAMEVEVPESLSTANMDAGTPVSVLVEPISLVDSEEEAGDDLGLVNEPAEVIAEDSRSSQTQDVAKLENRKRSHSEEEDDGQLCPICLDKWTNSGEHRVCCLKCGHVFGYSCIKRWLSLQPKRLCPTCKKKVREIDIRCIYAKKLVAVDTTETERLKSECERITQEKNKVQMESICKEHQLQLRIKQLEKQVVYLNDALELRRIANVSSEPWHVYNRDKKTVPNVSLYMDKAIEICKNKGCRVIDCNVSWDLIAASIKSPLSLFSGYGIRKFSIANYKPTDYIHLHSEPIRDMAFHSHKQNILTVSLDKKFKVVDTQNNTTPFTGGCDNPIWSCCWNTNNENQFYVGTAQGWVLKYDLRNIDHVLEELQCIMDKSPVVSLASIPASPGDAVERGGIVACKLLSVTVFEENSSASGSPLPLIGPFCSLRYQSSTKQLLVSCRPSSKQLYAKHIVCNIDKATALHPIQSLKCNIIYEFNAGLTQKLLSRPCFVSNQNDFIAAHNETNRCILLWSVNNGTQVASVPTHEPVLDMCGIQVSGGNYIVSVTERKLEFFKFT